CHPDVVLQNFEHAVGTVPVDIRSFFALPDIFTFPAPTSRSPAIITLLNVLTRVVLGLDVLVCSGVGISSRTIRCQRFYRGIGRSYCQASYVTTEAQAGLIGGRFLVLVVLRQSHETGSPVDFIEGGSVCSVAVDVAGVGFVGV